MALLPGACRSPASCGVCAPSSGRSSSRRDRSGRCGVRRWPHAACRRGNPGRVADIAIASPRSKGVPTQAVMVALASTRPRRRVAMAGWRRRARGLDRDAGPSAVSLARMRRTLWPPERIEAYVALERHDGPGAGARRAAAGCRRARMGLSRTRTGVPGRARGSRAAWLRRSIGSREVWRRPGTLAQVCICGGLPELRTMAIGLMEALDVEVETLDSLFGIDAARLPEAADEFREHAAELPAGVGAAADGRGPSTCCASAIGAREDDAGAGGGGRRRRGGSRSRVADSTKRLVAIGAPSRTAGLRSRRSAAGHGSDGRRRRPTGPIPRPQRCPPVAPRAEPPASAVPLEPVPTRQPYSRAAAAADR